MTSASKSLVLSLGSNQSKENTSQNQFLQKGVDDLKQFLQLIAVSPIYHSAAVDYTDQPDFVNICAKFQIPSMTPRQLLSKIHAIELRHGRERKIAKGPRTLDIDIIFWGQLHYQDNKLTIPHPRWQQREFVVTPLYQL